MNQVKDIIIVPLEESILQVAKEVAEEQANSGKSQAVFFNTLAVYAVHTYLNWVDINSSLDLSYSWHPIHRALGNMADLYLPEYGRLECCPVLPDEEDLRFPSEPLANRIGYVWVKFSESFQEVRLLGFSRLIKQEDKFALEALQPMKGLLTHLFHLEETREVLEEKLQPIQSGDDPVFEQIRETLKQRSLSEIAASFERIYRTEYDYMWAEKGANELMRKSELDREEMVAGGVQEILKSWGEDEEEDIESEIQYFAYDLLKELQELWEDE